MITSTDTSTGDTWTYSYNFAGQMTGAVETNSDDTVIAQTTYTYDALGNRIGMDENGTQTWTLYDGSDPIMDFNGSGSLEMRYLNGPTGDLVDTVIARERAGGTVAWYLPDRLGTIRDLINSSGSIIDHVDYSAFGTVLDESEPSEGDRMMGFAGMERDTVTGLDLAVNRVQNPGTERWTSQDPLGFAAGDDDLFRYTGNEPANAADPSGLLFGWTWEQWSDGVIIGPQALLGAFTGDYEWIMGQVEIAVNMAPVNTFFPAGCALTDENEAIRHATWQALLTLLYGETAAERIGDNHENLVPPTTPTGVLDAGRDQFNNAEGRKIGRTVANLPDTGAGLGPSGRRSNKEGACGRWGRYAGRLPER